MVMDSDSDDESDLMDNIEEVVGLHVLEAIGGPHMLDFEENGGAASDIDDEDDYNVSVNDDSSDSSSDNEEEEAEAAPAQVSNADDEDLEEDVINAIIAETKKPRTVPPEIKTEEFVVDLSFHPSKDLLAVATITGDVLIYSYSNEANELMRTFEVHTKACRDIEFSVDGSTIISTSKDKTIMLTDVETGQLKRFYDEAHETSVYCLSVLSENIIATGDDDGMLKVWDLRQNDSNPLFALREVEDYISAILTNDATKMLVMTSGDGYLTSINIGSRKMYVQSEPYEEELTCMGLFRGGSKLVVGSSKGKLYTYNWGEFGIHSDMFPGPKSTMSSMIPVTDRMAVVAGEEGILRAMHVVPAKNLGIVGQHSLAVETMDISCNGELIASSSHNNDIRFWNVSYFENFSDLKYNSKHDKKKELTHNLPSSRFTNAGDFFSGLAN